ncbi:phage terminase large subunit [Massilibacteroides sp.]|uniref:phage terminase large subunit n=1 Tax=Massilibacteroides sp. TaxID=2034766 RepID=UPI002607C436|nr:phage terminase large subunit [Massilibacteroides sp.]MDD4515654.1 phage terminase large subunit [Massilibacteroides sp.]
MKPTSKQKTALKYLTDSQTSYIGYGGGAGGGKTYLGCFWLMQLAFYAPGTKYFIGRDSLKDTRESVLQTFRKLAKQLDFKEWKYNDNQIIYNNGSLIEFLDLSFYPQKDPNYDRFGSKEYTCGWIEEAAPVHFKAFDILKTRVGRWLNEEFKIKSKILCTFNPSKTWVDYTFYRPFEQGTEATDTRFIPALYTDNPFLPDDYVRNLLSISDETTKQRLLFGNFNYDDDPAKLCEYDAIIDMFTNDHAKPGQRYISADLAMQGRDKFIAGFWDGFICTIEIDMAKSTGKEIETLLNEMKMRNGVGNSNIVADSDGLGAYLESYIKNIKTFHGGASPRNKKEYDHLKDECGFLLAEKINKREIKIICTEAQKEKIIQEVSSCLKRDNTYNDIQKKKLISKDLMKKTINRSPDYLDMLLMRMYFEVKGNNFAG